MITLAQLWVPIIGSAVVVFVLSSLIHMVFKWHGPDYRTLSNEDEVRAAIQKASPAPGQYMIPYCADLKLMQTAEFQRKFVDGPVGHLVLRARGVPRMGPALGQWFAYSLLIAIFVAYLAARTLPPAAGFAPVLRVVATVVFLAYGGGSVQAGIWMGKPWNSVAKELGDALIYGLGMGAVFGYFWPH